MAHITRLAFARHLRAEPNQYILYYRAGSLARKGTGLAYWFHPLSAAVAQVPVEDIETTFVLREWSSDFQEITVQVTLTYRFVDPEKAAQRINFSIHSQAGGRMTGSISTRARNRSGRRMAANIVYTPPIE